MQIIKKLISYNFNKGGNSKQYIVVHDTGNTNKGANAESHYKYFNGGDRGASAHYFSDDIQAVQCVEDNDRAWHSGKKYGVASRPEVGNSNSIGVEICVNSDGDYQKAFNNAVELVVYLMQKHNIPLNNVVTHYEACAKVCPASMSANNWQRWTVFKLEVSKKLNLSNEQTPADVATKILEMVKLNAISVGLFPSVKAAQMILESNYLKSELAQNANNGFGMKAVLSGNTWTNSAWDGSSVYTKKTEEQKSDGTPYTVTASFRKYSRIEDSIADHSAYLLGARNGNLLRYAGITEAADYREQITIIKNGGYATDISYVTKVCDIITKFNLDKYDNAVIASRGTRAIENTVDNAMADGVLIDRVHWLGVLSGNIKPNPEFIKIVFDRYHSKLMV